MSIASSGEAFEQPRADPASELMKIKAAYEKAVNEDKLEEFLPYLDKDFSGSMLFTAIKGADG